MHNNRIKKVLQQMKAQQINQLLITSPASLYYLTSHWVHPGERFLALYLNTEGEVVYFANELFHLSPAIDCPIASYTDSQNPIDLLMKYLKDTGIIGVDNHFATNFLLDLIGRLNVGKITLASNCINKVRMIKDKEEIKLLRESSQINDLTMNDIIPAVHPSLTELELSHKLPEFYCSHGGNGYLVDPIVSYGANCADAHHKPDQTKLSIGDSIVFDMGIPYKSYCSDMTRTVFFGDVSKKFESIYHIVLKAQLAASAAVKPGIRCCDIDKIGRDIIAAEGYGKFFTHRIGHNIGIEGHEFPSISANNEMLLEEGMVFSVEPGIYIPNEGGVRIEDLVVVTANGCEILNHHPKDLQIITV